MNIIATADNLFVFFLGWEGVGVCSYLLINFWSSRLEANKSALKAILINRVGDCFLFLGMIFIALTCYTLDFSIFLTYFPSFYNYDLFLDIYFCNILISKYTLISLLLFGGVMGKSAQLGLHTWLPDAMEGPTPVSALIHAATMVTAGTFLLIRCAPIFQLSSLSITIITIVGAFTSFVGAIIGLFQTDIKKVIAYSTLSQLGYMVFACGSANYEGAMFHLVNHAFFKALLFLSAGIVIHMLLSEQDMRKMGGLIKLMSLTYIFMLIGSMSLIGFPFLTGFYSKEFILEAATASDMRIMQFAYTLGSITVFMTACYSIRLLIWTFIGSFSGAKTVFANGQLHEPSAIMIYPLIFLALASIFLGYVLQDLLIGPGSLFWQNTSIPSIHLTNNYFFNEEAFIDQLRNFENRFNLFNFSDFIGTEKLEWYSYTSQQYINNISFMDYRLKLLPLIFSLIGLAFGSLILYFPHMKIRAVYPFIFRFLPRRFRFFRPFKLKALFAQKLYFDQVYNKFLIIPFLKQTHQVIYILIEKGVWEKLGPLSIKKLMAQLQIKTKNLRQGFVYLFFLSVFLGITFLFLESTLL